MTHGITNRMTGGGTGRCLQTTETGGWMKGGLILWRSTCLTPASFDYILTLSSDGLSRNPPPFPTTLWATTSRTIRTTAVPIPTWFRRSSKFYYFWRRQRTYVDSATNPLRYSSIKTLDEVHSTSSHASTHSRLTLFVTDIGEVWANMLHNVYAALVGAHGFSTTAKTNPDGTQGNVVFLHLFLDALR